jgi:hypothetical protein
MGQCPFAVQNYMAADQDVLPLLCIESVTQNCVVTVIRCFISLIKCTPFMARIYYTSTLQLTSNH